MKKKRIFRDGLRGKPVDIKSTSRIMVYMLSQALSISPLEVYNLPSDLFKDMLIIYGEVEKIKSEEMEKALRKK